jgi:peptide/nickel transport system substrate-binding protein
MYNWIGQALAPTAPFNETHWHNPQWDSLLRQAEAMTDPGKRQELYFEMQKVLWDEGGYIIWGFYPLLDGLSLKVRGAIPNPANELGNWQFQTWWFSG